VPDSDHNHCPFLNRTDERCSPHFQVDDLEHAFVFCFGRYKTCPHYLELLVERRVRRLTSGVLRMNHPGAGTHGSDDPDHRHRPQTRPVFVQLTVGSGSAGSSPASAIAA
jgi:hypothetical protein